MKMSIGAFDCLHITSTALLGCSFVVKQGPKSIFRHERSLQAWIQPWNLSRIEDLDWIFTLTQYHVHSSWYKNECPWSRVLNPFQNLVPEIHFRNKLLILGYGGTTSSFFHIFGFICLFGQMFFEFWFVWSPFDIESIPFGENLWF